MSTRTPPRFVTRTMATTFATVVMILAAVPAVVTFIVRDRVRDSVIPHLTTQHHDTAAARAARKSALVAFSRP